MLPLLSADEKKKAEARLAVFMRAKNSTQLIAKLPAEAQAEWGVAMQMAQALRRQKKDEEAWKILLAEPDGDRARQARRLVGGAARQRLRRAQARQAQARLRPGARPRQPVRQRRQGCSLPGRLAGAAPSARCQAGARPLPDAGQDGRRSAEQGARPLLAGPHASRRWEMRPRRKQPSARPPSSSTPSTVSSPAWSSIRRRPPSSCSRPPRRPARRLPASTASTRSGRPSSPARPVSTPRLVRAFLNHLRYHLTSEAEVAMLAHLANALGDHADGRAHRQERRRART